MTSTIKSPYTPEQIKVWLRGLLTVAWADGHFDEDEQALITDMAREELDLDLSFFDAIEPISPQELAQTLGPSTEAAENFLRMAVMVALADGIYSTEEDDKLHHYCQALGLENQILESVRSTLFNPNTATGTPDTNSVPPDGQVAEDHKLDPLKPAREWLDQLEVHDPRLARFICKLIPSQCPFERDVTLFGRKVVHIPAMCKLNPLYEHLVGLRFRALSYLADECQEDVSDYL